jgi:CBS domain containing-hemolysin-like protein
MLDAVTPTLIVLLLLALNALFVAAEFAIVGVSRPTIERRASAGDWRARLVARILRDPGEQDKFIATAQLGITLASLGLGMYGEHLLAAWLSIHLEALGAGGRWIAAHTLGSVVAVAILTYFHIVIGEMVPKSIALQQAERSVLWIAPVMRVIQFIVLPLVLVLNGIGNAVLRVIGVRRDRLQDEHYRTPEELAYLVYEAQQGGLLRGEQARIVAELLDFGELTAGEVMVPRVRVAGIPLGIDADALRSVLREHPFTRYPVYDGTIDRVVGMLHVKDILRCLPRCERLRVDDVRAVPHLPATATMDQVMASLRTARAQMAVVMDEHGGTAGILTVEDLFEEVVGDIGDEPTPRPELRTDASGQLRSVGVTRLEALGDALGVDIEHEDVDTVSGLVLSLLGRPPRVGDVVSFRGVRIEVTGIEGNGVAEVRASLVGTTLHDGASGS